MLAARSVSAAGVKAPGSRGWSTTWSAPGLQMVLDQFTQRHGTVRDELRDQPVAARAGEVRGSKAEPFQIPGVIRKRHW
jgi:hypothetical protein